MKKKQVILKTKSPELGNRLGELLEKHGQVKLSGIGTFQVKKLGAKRVINVHDKTYVIIPAHNKVSFRATKTLKDTIQTYDGD